MQSSARPSCRSSDSAAVSSSLLKRSASTPLLSPSLTTLQRILHWSWPKMVSRSNSGITPSNYQSRTPPTHCSVASADSPFSGTHTGFMFPNFRASSSTWRQPQRRRSRWLFITSGRWRVRSSTRSTGPKNTPMAEQSSQISLRGPWVSNLSLHPPV